MSIYKNRSRDSSLVDGLLDESLSPYMQKKRR